MPGTIGTKENPINVPTTQPIEDYVVLFLLADTRLRENLPFSLWVLWDELLKINIIPPTRVVRGSVKVDYDSEDGELTEGNLNYLGAFIHGAIYAVFHDRGITDNCEF